MTNNSIMVSKIFGNSHGSYNTAQRVRDIAGIPLSQLTDEDFIPIPTDYRFNKEKDNYNVFIFLHEYEDTRRKNNYYVEEITIGNKPFITILNHGKNGKSFKRIVEDGEVTHIYMIKSEKRTLPKIRRGYTYNNEEIIKEVTVGSGTHYHKYERNQIAIAKKKGTKKQLKEAIIALHEAKAGKRHNVLRAYYNILIRQLRYNRLPKYKKSKLEKMSQTTIMSAVSNVFRECAEYYAGNNPTFPSKLPRQFNGSQRADINIHNFLSNMTSAIDDFHYAQESKYSTKDDVDTKKMKLFEYIRSFIREEVTTEEA